MQTKRYKPLIDKLFWIILIPTVILLALGTALACYAPLALFILIFIDFITLYFIIAPLFGYVELGEKTLFVKFGFFMKREIPYEKIRGAVKERKLYSDSLVSLKNAIPHVNIKYNSFDVITVSVEDNDAFIGELATRVEKTMAI